MLKPEYKDKNMKDKKAWIRIVEAFIAIIIVLGAVLVIMSKNNLQVNDDSEEIHIKQRQILNMVVKNEDMREKIIINEEDEIRAYIYKLTPKNWNFTIKICEINDICNAAIPFDKGNVYSTETIVTSTLINYEPKKLRFFVWMR